ncbi:hypothetical protein [Mycolicibacterium mengxianglii]|uniref:hypothetical protein n=1 Tax=Mycolicibacterium mengxianglii TaxID=2736649 RepID=UPI0018D0DE34|nr:hypothetical protein [Mycolicibacterium mengxianglii]
MRATVMAFRDVRTTMRHPVAAAAEVDVAGGQTRSHPTTTLPSTVGGGGGRTRRHAEPVAVQPGPSNKARIVDVGVRVFFAALLVFICVRTRPADRREGGTQTGVADCLRSNPPEPALATLSAVGDPCRHTNV